MADRFMLCIALYSNKSRPEMRLLSGGMRFANIELCFLYSCCVLVKLCCVLQIPGCVSMTLCCVSIILCCVSIILLCASVILCCVSIYCVVFQ